MEAEVRKPHASEKVDTERLRAYLREYLPELREGLELARFVGGNANLTYLLRSGEREYVLRRPPPGPLPPHAHDMGREYRVLEKLHPVYPEAPRAIHHCADGEVIGAPFFIMERRRGIVVRREVPDEFGGGRDADANRAMSTAMVRALARLHRVDFDAAGLGPLGRASGFMKRQARSWAQAYFRVHDSDRDGMGDLIDWLKKNIPAHSHEALVHNDWRLDNIMLDPRDPGQVTAVFDWDMSTPGEPLADLGTLLTLWFQADENEDPDLPSLMPSRVPGFLTRREALDIYQRESGLDLSRMRYYYIFSLFKMGVIAAQIYARFTAGQTTEAHFASFGPAAKVLYRRAREVLGGSRDI